MSEVIVYKNSDGSCGIIIPVDFSIEESVQHVPAGCDYRITTRDNLPQDRYFRDAWTDHNNSETVDVDIDKARDIKMDKIRAIRDVKLAELDLPALQAVSKGDAEEIARLEEKKQTLRDIPQNVDLSVCQTLEELKEFIPEELQNV